MKAAAYKTYGDLDVLEIMELPNPEPDIRQVRLKVEACGVNHLDIWVRQGLPAPIPMPHIGGCDIVGVIDQISPEVTRVNLGQRVIIAPGQSCRDCDSCHQGRHNHCEHFEIMGFQTQGGFAEYAVADVYYAIPIPNTYTPAEWATIPLAGLTAWNTLINLAQLRAGEDVLIQAGGSGLGAIAIQVAKIAGARVWTTASTDEKLDKARELGADFTINYKEENFVERIQKDTNGRGVDVALDHVGKETWEGSIDSLVTGGRLVHCGVTTGYEIEIDLRKLYRREIKVLGGYMGGMADLKRVLALARQGRIKPVLDRVFPLEETAAAQQYMLDRKHFGKIVVEV
jgi:NADPH:quinone reductase-like Zn-dependent oxidoreductase